MGKLMVHQFVSLDGYAADAEGNFSLFENGEARTPEFDLELLVRLQLVDAILLGATTYRMFADYWPTPASVTQLIAPVVNTMQKIVFSHNLDEAPWGEYAPAQVESGDVVEAVRRLKEERFGDLLVWGSLSLTDELFAAGLVDSVRISVLPVILGSGRSAFPNGFSQREVRLVATSTFDETIVATEYAIGTHVPTVSGVIAAAVAAPDVAPEPEPEPLPERLFESDSSGAATELPLPEAESLPGAELLPEPLPGAEPPPTGEPVDQVEQVAEARPVNEVESAPDSADVGTPSFDEQAPAQDLAHDSSWQPEPSSAGQGFDWQATSGNTPASGGDEDNPPTSGTDEAGFDWHTGTENPPTSAIDEAEAGTPQVEDSATAENPPLDAEEAERLVSRRKWD